MKDREAPDYPDVVDLGFGNVAVKCQKCQATGRAELPSLMFSPGRAGEVVFLCDGCGGIGFTGVNPMLPTLCPVGSMGRAVMLAVRAASGVMLWNHLDNSREEKGGIGEARHASR